MAPGRIPRTRCRHCRRNLFPVSDLTDLTTELVKEFTELQGVIGGLYIRTQWHQEGYPEHGAAIADAIYSQYIPASMEDAIPATVEGQLFGLADRIQTIVSMFGIGQAPTGSKEIGR